MKIIPKSVAIFGCGPHVADIALRNVLKLNQNSGPVVILDYTGRGALVLGQESEAPRLQGGAS